jgi:hypothetical protein
VAIHKLGAIGQLCGNCAAATARDAIGPLTID